MRIKNFIIAAVLAGLTYIPASVTFGAERSWGSVECWQFLKTPEIIVSSGSLKFTGSTPTVVIGDGGAEDTKLKFDGNAQDYSLGIDDTDDTFQIVLGSVLGTTERLKINASDLGVVLGDATEANVWTEYDGNAVNFHTGIVDATDKFVIGLGSVLDTTERLTFNSADLGIIVGDATAADVWFQYAGNAQSYYHGIDDSVDDWVVGTGTTVGTNVFLSMNEAGQVVVGTATAVSATADLQIGGTTPELTIGDSQAEDTILTFDGNAIDYFAVLDDTDDTWKFGTDTLGTTPIISMNSARTTTFGGAVVYNTVTYIDDATPDVGNSTVVNTGSNTSALTITDLDNPRIGSFVTLVTVGGAHFTKIADGGNFNIAGAGGWNPDSADDNITFYIQADNDYIQVYGTQTNN